MPVEDPVAAAWYGPDSRVIELSAQTAALEVTPNPWGSPSGPGLWRHKGLSLPIYVEQISKGIMKSGRAASESEAIGMAIGVLKRWARGGGKVTPEVRAAAAKAIAEWEALKAGSHAHASDEPAIDLAHAPYRYRHGWIPLGSGKADSHLSAAREADAAGHHAEAVKHLNAAIAATPFKSRKEHLKGLRGEIKARQGTAPRAPEAREPKPARAGHTAAKAVPVPEPLPPAAGLPDANPEAVRTWMRAPAAQLRADLAKRISAQDRADIQAALDRKTRRSVPKTPGERFPLKTDVTLHYEPGDGLHRVVARTPDGRQAGVLEWSRANGDIAMVKVSPAFRRMGVASAMLGHAQGLKGVRKPRHSANRTAAGIGWSDSVGGAGRDRGRTKVILSGDQRPVDLAGMFTEALHPRAAGGKFGAKGGSPVAAARARNAPKTPAAQARPGTAGPMTRAQQLRYQASQDRHLAGQIMMKVAGLVRQRDAAIAGISVPKAAVSGVKSAAAKKAAATRKASGKSKQARAAARIAAAAKAGKPQQTTVQRLNGQIRLLTHDARLLAKAANHLDQQAAGM